MPIYAVVALLLGGVAGSGSGRFALQSTADGGWTLVRPDGAPTFVLALNHLANPFYD
jgi:hypothetical protein